MLSGKAFQAERQVETALSIAVTLARLNEHLSKVVIESMTHMGAVSSSYRFKILSQDAKASSFIVLVEFPSGAKVEPKRLGEIEAIIRRAAHARFEIRVKCLYWRFDETPLVLSESAVTPVRTIPTGNSKSLPEPPIGVGREYEKTRISDYQPATDEEIAELKSQFSQQTKLPERPWRDTEMLESEGGNAVIGATQYSKLN